MDIRELLRDKGIVGAGGGGFPTYAKLQQQGIDYYIANGAECEPLLDVSKEIMARFPDKVLKGLNHLKEYTGAKKGSSCIKAQVQKCHQVAEGVQGKLQAGCGVI